MKVKARRDLVSAGGLPIAEAGDTGRVALDRVPTRKEHYGLVPVYWGTRSRAYWVSASDLKAVGRGDVRKLVKVSPVPEKEPTLPVPRRGAGQSGYNFGRMLQRVRQARGLSQEALAKAMRKVGSVRVSQATLSKWEARADSPSGEFIAAVAAALDVPAFMFFVEPKSVEGCMEFLGKFLEDLRRGGTDARGHTLEKVSG